MSGERAPRMMSFVSEKELEEVKRKRQEEWEKARKPNDPVERPEEVYDPRPLYERLKEQRDRKQEEWEEQFKFKNMIYKGLDDEEAVFLQMVADKKAAHNAEVAMIEREELSEFRQAVAELAENDSRPLTATSPTSLSSTSKKTSNTKVTPSRTKLASMIGTSIRRKRSSSDGTERRHSTSASLQDKKLKLGDSSKDTCTGGHTTASTQDHGDPKVVVAPTKLNTEETSDMQCKTQTMFSSLPGMAEYSNSSDDDEDDN